MLTTENKRKIDSIRNTLVGKIPVPTQQVDQITLGLIYKFMSDIDEENTDLGGHSFFNDEYKKYAWKNIMNHSLSGQERVVLYAEGLEKMSLNKNLPQLFRDIFRGAYLPFKDTRVLNEFLKGIDEFTYDHSEDLGDAFEYLLSIMGSQGDAGQFRTPRHIIDFIVAAVDPQKENTILDPACGTAGFLVSSYKHILNQNKDPKSGRPGGLLSTVERQKLAKNFIGYDISHDMHRLSLVNMYLHNFPDPHIYEYDTLTDLDKWDYDYDCILANPPFMSPRGGIRPHNRFSIQSNRSEVLFVDYIVEHLTSSGRAGVIVPEGIIFQTGNAYKALRKTLIDNGYLYAVISLPSGVFRPYAGVKTSILLMDRALARKTENIMFIKIENDGFSLGDQRTPIEKDDIPSANEIISRFKQNISVSKELSLSDNEKKYSLIIPKTRIRESGDYNLNGERYRENIRFRNQNWPFVKMGDVAEIISGQSPEGKYYNEKGEGTPFYQGKSEFEEIYIGKPSKWTTQVTKKANKNDVLMSVRAPVGPVNIATQEICIGRGLAAIRVKENLNALYLFYLLKNIENEIRGSGGSVFDSINRSQIESIEIPLPPIEYQEQVVSEIMMYQNIIIGAQLIVNNYKSHFEIDPEWPLVTLGEYLSFVSSGATPLGGKNNYLDDGILFIRSQNILWGKCDFSDAVYISKNTNEKMKRSVVKENDVLLNITGASIGRCAIYRLGKDANVNQHVAILRTKHGLTPEYLMHCLLNAEIQNSIMAVQSGASRQALNYQQIKQLKIPLPDLDTQKQIVTNIEHEQHLIMVNEELIIIYKQKITGRISKIWGD